MQKDKDLCILKQIIQKDEKAIYIFYKRYKKSLIHFVSKKIPQEDVEEVVHDALISFFESARSFRGESLVKTFLFSITSRRIADYHRKKRIKRVLFSHLPSYFVESIGTVLFDDELERKELLARLEHTLDSLPNDYALILRLKYWQGKKVDVIARQLKLSFKAAESMLFRARKAFIIKYSLKHTDAPG